MLILLIELKENGIELVKESARKQTCVVKKEEGKVEEKVKKG